MRKRLRNVSKTYGDSKVFYDPAFQRRVVWERDNVNKYFESLTKDWALQSIVQADVEACLEFSVELGNDISESYFRDILSQGYKFISLDGQNRTKSIINVLSNNHTLSGIYKDADGELVNVQNVFFKDLPPRLKDHLNSGCSLTVHHVTEATKDDLSLIFRALNDGMPLNNQELRQANKTPIADWVRQMSARYSTAMARITREDHISRMADDENIAKLALCLVTDKNWELSSRKIDEWYTQGLTFNTLEDAGCPYDIKQIKRVEKILKMFSAVINNQTEYPKSKLVPKRLWYAVAYACEWMYDNNCQIASHADFFATLKKIDTRLAADSELQYSLARHKKLQDGDDPEQISPDHYYFRWQNLPHMSTYRKARKNALFNEIVKNKSSMKIRQKAKSAA